MKSLESQIVLIAYIISNILAILFLMVAWKWPRISRLLFFVLFASASSANWNMTLNNPRDYLGYADLTFLQIYKTFILGWFSDHIQLSVGLIATAQALIAVSFLLKGWVYKVGWAGAIVFLVSIIPFGVGSAFPCTLILAIALGWLWNQDAYLWQHQNYKYERDKYIFYVD